VSDDDRVFRYGEIGRTGDVTVRAFEPDLVIIAQNLGKSVDECWDQLKRDATVLYYRNKRRKPEEGE